MSIRISLVFPLTAERGLTAEALTAWTRQTFPAERFELIVVADNATAIDPQLPPLLRPQDRILRGTFANLAHQFDAGVRAGNGELLFLTESHCLPAPDCLEAMDRFLVANPRLVGACCESVPSWENTYQKIDATTFEEGYRLFVSTNDWRKLSIHGMALQRDLFLALGGFQHQYGRFAEMLLAATLRDAGHILGYARESVVTHHYRETLQELIDGTAEYVREEFGYRVANPGPDRVGHSYQPNMPNPYSPGAVELDREVAAALLGSVFGSTSAMREAFRATGRVGARLLGRRGPVLAAWFSVVAGRFRCWRNRHDPARLNLPYRDLIVRASKLARTQCLAEQPPVDTPLPAPSPSIAINGLPEWALRGFHGIESWNGASFRWSESVAALRLPLPRGQYRLRLVTHGLRRDRVCLQVAMNGTRIAPIVLPDGDYELPIERSHCHRDQQTLILKCNPLRPWRQGVVDHRELGLPLFAVEAQPASAAMEKRGRKAA
jgi:Glycosyl transferase family 2